MPSIEEIKAEVDQHYAELLDDIPHTEEQTAACKALIYLFWVTFKYHMYDETAKLVAEHYIQHNEELTEPGRQSIIAFSEKRFRGSSYFGMRFKRIFVDGDFIIGQLHVKMDPDDEGVRVCEIMRYKNGIFLEHWDTVQPVLPADKRPNPNPVF